MKTRGFITVPLLLLAGMTDCSRSVGVPPVSPPSPTPDVAVTTRPTYWNPKPTGAPSHYLVIDSSIVSINNDTSNKHIPFVTTATYELTFRSQHDSFSVHIRTDSITILSSQSATNPRVSLLFTAVMSPHGGLSQLEGESSTSCNRGLDPLAGRIFDLVTPLPRAPADTTTEWTDTTTAIICRGKTALKQFVIRRYRFLSDTTWNNKSAVKAHRATSITIEGTSPDSSNHTAATGSGSSEATLFLDRSTGELLKSDGQSQLVLTITTSRGSFPFKQSSSTHIERHE